jgi:hypothetical protein
MGLGEIGPQRERPPLRRFRRLDPAQRQQSGAEIGMRFGQVGAQGHRHPDQGGGLFRLAPLELRHAGEMQHCGIVRPLHQHPAIEFERRFEPALPVLRDGLFKKKVGLGQDRWRRLERKRNRL